jgi:inhibitor of cysteine peptidase
MRTTIIVIVILFSLWATQGLAQGRPEETQQTPAATLAQAGSARQPTISKSYEVAPGKRFKIMLESNRSTGYQWRLARPVDQAVVKLMGSGYESPRVKLPGAGGKEIWTFQAVGRGRTEITMKYIRPWEKGEAPARTARFVVVVR